MPILFQTINRGAFPHGLVKQTICVLGWTIKKILTSSISAMTSLILFPVDPPLEWKTLIRSLVRRSSSPRNLEVRGTVVNRINSKLICKTQYSQDTELNRGICSSVECPCVTINTLFTTLHPYFTRFTQEVSAEHRRGRSADTLPTRQIHAHLIATKECWPFV